MAWFTTAGNASSPDAYIETMSMNHTNKKAGAPFPARLIAVSLPPEKALITPSVFPVLQKSLRPCPSANRKGRPPATPFRHIRYSPPQ
ncbi:hypothetical protein DFY03_24475, partial [Escherichia coli]|nr:hypothetical protein [Escherichia coli]